MAISKFQKFKIETICRSDIKSAAYNPRVISQEAKKRLHKNIGKHGLVQPLVWNRRTGNLVSGHQRLEILDSLEKSQDYALEVSVIDITEKDERILNVQLNNPSMQGEWDLDKLTALANDADISPDQFGFSEGDIAVLFGQESLDEILIDKVEVSNTKQKFREIKEKRKRGQKEMEDKNDADFYFTVVCENKEQKQALMRYFGIPEWECFVNGSKIASKLGI